LNAIEGVHCQLPKGAFYVFPNIEGVVESLGVVEAYNALPADLRCETSPATLFQLFLLHHYHVATMDRRSFGTLESEGQHFLRLSVATGAKDLAEAVARISEASEDTDGFRQFVRSGVKLDL